MNAFPEQLVGRILGGRYRLDRVIGRGGMGVVFQATQLDLGRVVAVKVLLDLDPHAIARLRQEALTAGSLSCPYVVSIFDFQAPPNEAAFVVMELLSGESLASLLARERQLEVGRACRIAMEALVGLDAAHRAAVVHRDIKPSNLWLSSGRGMDGHVKVLDFGIAKRLDGSGIQTTTGSLMGTPAYLSPEQLRGLVADARSDQHAIGIVLFEMLTGRRIWQASAVEQLFEIVQRVPPLVHEIAPHVPAPLSAIVARALAKDPTARFSSADEMRLCLAPFATPPTAAPPTVPGMSIPVAGLNQPTMPQSDYLASPSDTTRSLGRGGMTPGVEAFRASVLAPTPTPAPARPRSLLGPLLGAALGVLVLGLAGVGAYVAWVRHGGAAAAVTTADAASPAATTASPSATATASVAVAKSAPPPTTAKPAVRPALDAGTPSDAGASNGTKPNCSCISRFSTLICLRPKIPRCFCNAEGSALCPVPLNASGDCPTETNQGAFQGAGLKTGGTCSGFRKGDKPGTSVPVKAGKLDCNFCYGHPSQTAEPAVPNTPCEGLPQGASTTEEHDKSGLWVCGR